jgi:YfiH family protein
MTARDATREALWRAAIHPDWPAPPGVHALVSTRAIGDMKSAQVRAGLACVLPEGAHPAWLHQVHGTQVVDAAAFARPVDASAWEHARPQADASVAHAAGAVCVVMAADCMPVLLAARDGSAVGAAHAGWRGLCAGVIEATVGRMRTAPDGVMAYLGPAIGPQAYEVGEEVRASFIAADAQSATAFKASRPGHWMLDLYAVARQRLATCGVREVHGGTHCTLSEPARFWSYRRDGASERMAAFIWRTG